MSRTFTRLLYHIVFSTQNREPWITPKIEPEVYAYLVKLLTKSGGHVFQIGGMPDHIHIAVQLPPKPDIARVIQNTKAYSSGWFKRRFHRSAFNWQKGYAAFTISPTQIKPVMRYIANQKQHHRRASYRDELKKLLALAGLEFTEEDLD